MDFFASAQKSDSVSDALELEWGSGLILSFPHLTSTSEQDFAPVTLRELGVRGSLVSAKLFFFLTIFISCLSIVRKLAQ